MADPGAGLGTRVQVAPFQRAISVLPLPGVVAPTAQALLTEVAETPWSMALVVKEAAGPEGPD